MVQKMTSIRSVDKLLEILETVSKNLDTNLTTDEILSFYNIFKQILISTNYQSGDAFHIEQLKVAGTGKMIYYKNLGTKLWNYILDEKSISEVSKTMKMNLEIIDVEPIKTFEFHP